MKAKLFILFLFFLPGVALAQTPTGDLYVRYYWDTDLRVADHKQELKFQSGMKVGLKWGPYTRYRIHATPFLETMLISSGASKKHDGHFVGASGDFGGGFSIDWLDHWVLTVKFSSLHVMTSAPNEDYIQGAYNFVEVRYRF